MILSCSAQPEPKVRVVLISLDTLRFDQLNPESDAPAAMPRTLEWARRGRWFSRFYVPAPITQPTHASMFTGLQPWEHGITRNGVIVSEQLPNVIEQIQQAGFATAAVVASFPLTKRFGFGRGFGHFSETFSRPFIEDRSTWENQWKLPGGDFFATGEEVTNQALALLDQTEASRQLFWFHYFDPHSPYGSSHGSKLIKADIVIEGRRRGESVETQLGRAREGYAADVSYLDTQLDRLLRRLEADSGEFETHVFVVSDHGESFGEGGYVGHGNRLTEEQLRVPAFLLSPHVEPGPSHDIAAAIDVARTLLALAGVEADDARVQGRDLTQEAPSDSRAFAMRRTFRSGASSELGLDGQFHTYEGNLYCEVDDVGTIIRGDGQGELLQADAPGLGPDQQQAIRTRFRGFEKALAGTRSIEDVSPETEEALRALGYIK